MISESVKNWLATLPIDVVNSITLDETRIVIPTNITKTDIEKEFTGNVESDYVVKILYAVSNIKLEEITPIHEILNQGLVFE